MKSFLVLSAISLIFMTSCHERMEPNYACSVSDPLENIGWLSVRVQELEESPLSSYYSVIMARYKSKTVFVTQSCCPFCASAYPSVINCEGETIGKIGPGEGGIDFSRLKNIVVIWEGEDFACGS
ncbi:hypothetical protein [Aquiflexum sp.]|uniref:hypothetical protein n=1 Tax=Aquiflexum sp. TaxID=1872584 RepID=UPI0035944A97